MSILDTLKLIHGEWTALKEFPAYVIPGSYVQATLRGLRVTLQVSGDSENFARVAILSPDLKTRTARFIRNASSIESALYLSQFDHAFSVLFKNKYSNWMGVSMRFVLPVYGVPEFIQEFETVKIRKIGNVWVYEHQSNEFPGVSSGLRVSMENNDRVIMVRGATPDHRIAYMEKVDEIETQKPVIPDAISFMGGKLIDIVRQDDETSLITYSVQGSVFTSLVSTKTMQVISAGICLDDEDSNFDLTTLIPVIRKGIQTNRIHRTGIN